MKLLAFSSFIYHVEVYVYVVYYYSDYATKGESEADPMHHLEKAKVPVIGALEGASVTGGVEIAVTCDILIAGESASFRDTHVLITSKHSCTIAHQSPQSLK